MENSYLLSTVNKITDDGALGPTSFHLVLPTSTITLQAESQEDAKDWVEKINSGEYRMVSVYKKPPHEFVKCKYIHDNKIKT